MNGDTRSISAAALCRAARQMHDEALHVVNGGGSTSTPPPPPLDAEDEAFVLSVFGGDFWLGLPWVFVLGPPFFRCVTCVEVFLFVCLLLLLYCRQ